MPPDDQGWDSEEFVSPVMIVIILVIYMQFHNRFFGGHSSKEQKRKCLLFDIIISCS